METEIDSIQEYVKLAPFKKEIDLFQVKFTGLINNIFVPRKVYML